jgi:hypothetical protein
MTLLCSLSRSVSIFLAVGAALASLALGVLSCAAHEPTPANGPQAASIDLDGDALALLPPGAVTVATVDVHAFYESHALGGQVGALADALLPLMTEAGVVPSRDVERVTFASYALQGADAVVVLRGRFDPGAVARTAAGVLAATPYSGQTMYTHGNVGFAVLTGRTILGGSGAGLRLALDRIRDGRVKVELPPGMLDTLRTKDVVAAFAADFTSSPLTALQGLPIPPWATAVKGARGVVTLREPGVNVSGSITFDDPAHATAGVEAVRQLGALINTMAVAGVVPQLRNFAVSTDGANVQVTFAIDEASARSVLEQIPQFLPSPKLPPKPGPSPSAGASPTNPGSPAPPR